jgi:hypothetical protein
LATLPGPGIQVSTTQPPFGVCLEGSTSDGSGTVLLGLQGQFDSGDDNWSGFDSSGSRLGTASAGPMIQPPLFPLESGFQWFNSGDSCSPSGRGCTRRAVLRQLSSSLQETSRTTLFEYRWTDADPRPRQMTWDASKDTGRGVLVTHVQVSDAGWTLFAQRFDSSGRATTGEVAVASGVASQQPARALSGVSQKGPALVLWDHGSGASRAVEGRWLGTSGDTMTDPFTAADGVHAGAKLSLSRLLDGSLVLQQDGAWTRRFQPGATAVEAAPDWLATRPNTTLSIIRGATAHLLTFRSLNCEPVHAALFAASGTRCGAMEFPAASCPHTAASGFDGTVIVTGLDEAAGRCTRTFWPGLLR